MGISIADLVKGEKMADLIERQAAIDVLATMQGRCTSKAALVQNSKIWQQIKDLPSAQQDVSDTNVGDMISRQAALLSLDDEITITGVENAYAVRDYVRRVKRKLESLPAAEPQIIRCMGCKHWMPYDWMFSEVWRSVNMDDYSDDEIGCAYCDMNMHANDFCSRAERKEDG